MNRKQPTPVIYLHAPFDVNGNGRRLWFIPTDKTIYYDDGSGCPLNRLYGSEGVDWEEVMSIKISATTFRQIKKGKWHQ